MPLFAYRARDAVGRELQGEIEAADRSEVATRLVEQGLFVISVQETKPKKVTGLFAKPSSSHVVAFMRQLATMVRAGIPIMTALEMILQRAPSQPMRRLIESIRDTLASGEPLSAAIEKNPDVFPPLVRWSVKVGEETGQLDAVLMRLAAYKELESNLKASVRGALAYPAVIVLVAIGVASFIVTVVIPKIKRIYDEAHILLPLPTRIVLFVSDFVKDWWPLLIAGAVGVVLAIALFKRTRSGCRFFDRLFLRIPIIGKFVYLAALLRFTRSMELMVRTGVDVVQALNIAAGTIGNSVLEDGVRRASFAVRDGAKISEAVEDAAVFEPLLVQMLRVGEETGTVDELLDLLASDYENQISRMVQNLPRIIEPILLVFVAGLVFLLALSFFLPIFRLVQVLKKH